MKIRNVILWLSVLCLCLALGACGNKEKVYLPVDYDALVLSEYVTLGDYKGIRVEVPELVVDISSVSEGLAELVSAHTTFEEYATPVTDREAVAGDYVKINFKGYLEGQLLASASAEGASILLGEDNGYVEWLDDDLYGLAPGGSVTTTGTFPEGDYYAELAGREVTMEIELVSILGHYTIPALNDDFVSEHTEYDTLEAYREAHIRPLVEAAEADYENQKIQAMWEQVLALATVIKLPEQQVEYYYQSYRAGVMEYAEMYDYTYEEYLAAVGLTDEGFRASAEGLTKDELVFFAIVKAENYTVSDEDYAEGVVRCAEGQGMTVAELEAAYDREFIEESILRDKVLLALHEQAEYVVQ